MTAGRPTLVKLKVHPDAKADAVRRRAEDSFEIWVRAPAKEGRANAAALRLLAVELRRDLRRLRLVKGATSPSKIVQVYEEPQ